LSETVTALKKLIDEDYAEPDPIERADAEPPAEGLPVGALAPAFSLRTLDGGQVSLRDLLAIGRPVLLLFVSPSCSPCKSLLPVIRVWERDYGAQLTIALLSKGSVRDVQAKLAKYEVRRLLLQGESTIADDYQAKWTPAAVLIGPDGKIASPVLAGDDAIKSLVNHTVAVGAFLPTENQGVGIDARRPRITAQIRVGNSLFRVGEPAPKFALPDLRGKSVNTETLLGRETLLLFWDADCPFCRAMADDLNQWEEASSNGAPRLVYVVSGDVEAARGKHQGLKSLTLIDEDFDIGPLFGTDSAPSGILIDGEGNIASGLAKGARNILALLGIRKVELPIAPASARASAKEASQGAVGESAAK
jgi:thiol-disulfide isomerase/thioredoxin